MLHTNSRGDEGIFYKVPGRMGVYTLKKDVLDGLKELSEGSEESSDVHLDSPASENSSSSERSNSGHSSSSSSSGSSERSSPKDGRKSRWRRKVSTRLSQVSSPQLGTPSPSGKAISSSQKHSKKALKQALKQKQRKQQQCRASTPVTSGHLLLLQPHSKAVSHASAPAKSAWEAKQSDGHSSSPPNSTSSSSPSVKAEPSLPVLGKKPFQRSDRLHARQLKRTKCAEIDVETPDSILVNTNLRALINKHTFSLLPADCQQRLLLLLPEVDRQVGMDGLTKLSSSALNNEFFTSAAQSWKERLSEGEFTPEMQLRLRQELEKEKKVELWKEHFFERYYGQSSGMSPEESQRLTSSPPAVQSPAAQLQKCPPAVAVDVKEEHAPRPPSLLAPPPSPPAAASQDTKEEEEKPEQRPASPGAPAGPIESSVQAPRRLSRGAEEPAAGEKQEEKPQDASKPKNLSPAAATAAVAAAPTTVAHPAPQPSPREEVQTAPAAETPTTSTEQMDTSTRPLKRKPEGPEEASLAPEKRPHVSEKEAPTRPPSQAPPQHFPTAPVPKVPPLRIPVSRLQGVSVPLPSGQGRPPQPSFPITIPRRTGARTLADIKARAQMARAQRAAAVAAQAAAAASAGTAASVAGVIPGPGPGGGRAEGHSGPGPGGPCGAALDLAGPTGSGPGQRRPLPTSTGPWPTKPAATAAPESTSLGSAAGAQLQQRAPGQTRPASAEAPPTTRPAEGSASHTGPRPVMVTTAQSAQGPPAPNIALSQQTEGPGRTLPPSLGPALTHRTEGTGATCGSRAPSGPPLSQAATDAPFKAPPRPPLSQATPVTPPPSRSLSVHPGALGGSPPSLRSSSSIPANNPLVTQLLQGKEVSMEQILPKTHLRAEMRTVPVPTREGQAPATAPPRTLPPREVNAGQSLPPAFSQAGRPPHGPTPASSFPGQDVWGTRANPCAGQDATVQGMREEVLPALLHLAPLAPGLASLSSRLPLLPPDFPPESVSTTNHCSMPGFIRRRVSKPAMSGHYLLNVSTYGRCSENLRRRLAIPPEGLFCQDRKPDVEQEEDDDWEAGGSGSSSSGEDGNEAESNEGSFAKGEPKAGGVSARLRIGPVKAEHGVVGRKEGALPPFPSPQDYSAARELIREHGAQAGRGEAKRHASVPADSTPLRPPLLLSPSHPASRLFGSPGATAQLVGAGYSGTINVSASPDLPQEALLTGLSDPGRMGEVVSFSVTVTTIPAGQAVSSPSSPGRQASLRGQVFPDEGVLEELPSKCYCRLKAMIVCQGCGAFCHDDCIGPSRLCVSCLVVR
ncbi:putative Polycomb group protein ASXL2 isoform X2 [Anolis carolinensis]|uniref:putative Polycomb group protein ASXL2 isoform X2 n=1 Tax=Anolis carolinensis TaxID=28377 RepID=UPI002F2B34A2